MPTQQGRRLIIIAGALYLSALAIQFFHLVEHLAQVYQHWWLGLRGQGLLFFLDLEWNHFLFNLGYFTLLAWILGALWVLPKWNELRRRVAVASFILAVLIQAYHVKRVHRTLRVFARDGRVASIYMMDGEISHIEAGAMQGFPSRWREFGFQLPELLSGAICYKLCSRRALSGSHGEVIQDRAGAVSVFVIRIGTRR